MKTMCNFQKGGDYVISIIWGFTDKVVRMLTNIIMHWMCYGQDREVTILMSNSGGGYDIIVVMQKAKCK